MSYADGLEEEDVADGDNGGHVERVMSCADDLGGGDSTLAGEDDCLRLPDASLPCRPCLPSSLISEYYFASFRSETLFEVEKAFLGVTWV